jgi:hypothetical protein
LRLVLTRTTREQGTLVYVLPITHRAPVDPESGIEIPRATRQRLGLDGERSWIITSELNRLIWPGPDLRALPSGEYSYGYLPTRLVRAVLDQVRVHAHKGSLSSVPRDP